MAAGGWDDDLPALDDIAVGGGSELPELLFATNRRLLAGNIGRTECDLVLGALARDGHRLFDRCRLGRSPPSPRSTPSSAGNRPSRASCCSAGMTSSLRCASTAFPVLLRHGIVTVEPDPPNRWGRGHGPKSVVLSNGRVVGYQG